MSKFKPSAAWFLPVSTFDADSFAVRVRRPRRGPVRRPGMARDQLTVNGGDTPQLAGPGDRSEWLNNDNNLKWS